MKIQGIALGLTVVNLALAGFTLSQMQPARAWQEQQKTAPVLRGRALEIVDSLGRVRASISIQPPVLVDGKPYPETVLLRLINDRGGPLVKLAAGDVGAGLSLTDQFNGGILLQARDTGSFIKISSRGSQKLIRP